MNEKELREIKRRFRPEKNSILSIHGCLVNVNKEIIATFNQPMATCNMEETEKLLSVMKKSLSGGLGTNLLDIAFSNEQVANSEEHSLLMALRDSSLRDEEAVNRFYKKIIESIKFDGNFAVLLASDRYDVFTYSTDGEKEEDSAELFSYFICAVCPVKPLSAGLYFNKDEHSFRSIAAHSMLSNPEIGFMFPTFDNRTANIYNALYYTKDIANIHTEFIEGVFNTPTPMPASEQKETFESCLKETLDNECDYEVLRSVHQQISEMVEEHKASKDDEPLTLSKRTLKGVLEYCGVDSNKVEQFGERFEEQFGKNTELTPSSVVNVKKFELNTPDVTIKVNPERKDLVSTQVINGVRYIMIRANEGVEVNGVSINIE